MKSRRLGWGLGLVLALASVAGSSTLTGCAAPEMRATGTGAQFILSGDAAGVTRVTIVATPTAGGRTFTTDLVQVGEQWRGTLVRLPVGAYTFTGSAFDAMGTVLYTGNAGGTITEGTTSVIAMNMQQQRAPDPFQNDAPIIDTLVASSADVTPGAVVSLGATAHDPDVGDTMTYQWSAPAGTFSAPNALITTWTAPMTEGNYRLTLTVSDNHGASASTRYTVRVNAANGRGDGVIEVHLLSAPEITAFTLGAPDDSETSTLSVTATDPDGDPLTYSWASSCDGYFAGSTANNRALANSPSPTTTFTQANPMEACILSVVVRDPDGNTNTGHVARGAGPTFNTAPVIEPIFLSRSNAGHGETVILRAEASDPDGTALVVPLTWTTTVGTLSAARVVTPMGGNYTEEVTWTAPSCFTPGSLAIINASVHDAGGLGRTQAVSIVSSASTAPLQTDVNNCGACGNVCSAPANSTPTCVSGGCGFSCNAGFHRVGASCVSDFDVNSCGPMALVCVDNGYSTPTCDGTSCGFTCRPGYGDCYNGASDGCETDTNVNPSHCGACRNACGVGYQCVAGSCTETPISCGDYVQLRHDRDGGFLHSHAINYASGSGQQQVTRFQFGPDGNDLWRVVCPGGVIGHNTTIRLSHVATSAWLHSHAVSAPVTSGQYEVSAYGNCSVSDSNDYWKVYVDGGGSWRPSSRVQFRHEGTTYYLHSHTTGTLPAHPNQFEVTNYPHIDEGGNYWRASRTSGSGGCL